MNRPLYIFDLDGTLACIDHRRHILDDIDDPQRWTRFYALCGDDRPNEPVIRVMETLRHAGADVWIFSGRSDQVRGLTVEWLTKHTSFMSWELETALVMRSAGDYTPDDKLKQLFLHRMLHVDRERLVAVFDDRDRVVQMWRASGITCFQGAGGDF